MVRPVGRATRGTGSAGDAMPMAAAGGDAAAAPTRFRWVVVALLMMGAAINYIDRVCMAVAAPKIQEEFGLTDTQIGLIIGIFQWGYVAAYILSGMFVDRIGARHGYPIIMFVWSLAGALTALATRTWHFVAFRLVLGIGEAGAWPTSNKVIAEWFPRSERPFACGLFNGGSTVGMTLGPPLVAAIVLAWGWRMSFVITGAIGFVWIVLWLALYGAPERHPRVNGAELARMRQEEPDPHAGGEAMAAPRRVPWRALLGRREVWGVLLLNASTATTWFVLSNWLPKYFYDVRGISYELLGWYSAMPMVGAVVGNIGGGWLLGWLMARRSLGPTKARRLMIWLSVTMMTCLIPAAYVDNALASAVLIAVVGIGYCSHAANILSSIADFVPREQVATLTGIQATGSILLTLPIVTSAGWIVQHYGYVPLFVAAALLPWLSVFSAYVLIRRFAPLST